MSTPAPHGTSAAIVVGWTLRDVSRDAAAAPRLVDLAAIALSSALLGCGSDAPDEPAARPNIVLISVDTLRADHLSCYGYERPTSPTWDALAARGVLFERCFSTTSWTLPAHLSMLTGLAISAHGICDDRLWARKGADGIVKNFLASVCSVSPMICFLRLEEIMGLANTDQRVTCSPFNRKGRSSRNQVRWLF